MSAEEETAVLVDAAAPTEETTPHVNGGDSGENNANNKSKQRRNQTDKKDEKPIEELFDLTKPIPKVEKPDKDAHDKQLQELSDKIDAIKETLNKVSATIDTTKADADARSGIQGTRTKLNELKAAKNALIEEKKLMRTQLDAAKNQTDKLLNEKKSTRSNVKFNSLDEIEAEIKKLQRKQETTSMSLNDEKRLIKEIDNLKASKRFVADLKSTDASIDNVKEQKKDIAQRISAKDKEIDEYAKQIKEVMDEIDQLNKKDSQKKDAMGELFKERDECRKQMKAIITEKDALRAVFREKMDTWYLHQRAAKKQKQMQYEEEKRRRDEERAARLALIEEEEAKKIPYEEEQGLCDFLADYLERTYLSKGDSDDKDDSGKKNDVVEVKEDPFAGLKPVNKKNDDEEYFGKGKGKKKRVRQMKKQDAATGPFTLSVDTFEQFGLLQLTPPTSIEQVDSSVKELREKKEWYKVQARGSVPTATEIRKANEKAAAKMKYSSEDTVNNNSSAKQSGGAKGGKQSFALSSDDFAPLGAGTAGANAASTTPFNSSWGKSSLQPTISNETPTPAEAATAAALDGTNAEQRQDGEDA